MTVDRVAIAQRHGVPVELADRLRGETREEVEADAAAWAALNNPPEPQSVEQVILTQLTAKQESDRAFIEMIHGGESTEESE
jgi:hypothetical protein